MKKFITILVALTLAGLALAQDTDYNWSVTVGTWNSAARGSETYWGGGDDGFFPLPDTPNYTGLERQWDPFLAVTYSFNDYDLTLSYLRYDDRQDHLGNGEMFFVNGFSNDWFGFTFSDYGVAQERLKMTQVSLTLGRHFAIADTWDLFWNAGLRWDRVDHDLKIQYVDNSGFNFWGPGTDYIRFKNNARGLGLSLGLTSTWDFADRWHWKTGFEVAFMNHSYDYDFGEAPQFPLAGLTFPTANIAEHSSKITPVYSLDMSVSWDAFPWWTLSLGYRYQNYAEMVKFTTNTSGSSPYSNAKGNRQDLTFDGLYVGMTFRF